MADELTTQDARTILGLMTEDEFGRAVGVVGSTVALWRNKGFGPPFYRFKRNIFYRTADVTQWIIENTWDPGTGELLIPAKSPRALVDHRTIKPLPGERKPPRILELDWDNIAGKPVFVEPKPQTITSNRPQAARAPDENVRSNRQQAVEDDESEEHAASAG